jgi:predicted DNA-binding transcriptional regulator YafY
MLSRYRGIPANAWLEEVISNLEYRFGVKSNSENVVAFEQNEQLKGLEFLSDLIDAAVAHQPLMVLYRTYAGKEKESILHPYHVKQYNNRWFLFGLEETSHGSRIANRPLDRIVKFSRADVKFIPNTEVDFKKHFQDVVGVTIPDDSIKVEKVLLRFDKERFPYVVSKPIHHSQTIADEDNYLIQIEVRPNKELEAMLLSFGPQVEILQPQWLRDQFAKKIQEYCKIYSTVQKDCTMTP